MSENKVEFDLMPRCKTCKSATLFPLKDGECPLCSTERMSDRAYAQMENAQMDSGKRWAETQKMHEETRVERASLITQMVNLRETIAMYHADFQTHIKMVINLTEAVNRLAAATEKQEVVLVHSSQPEVEVEPKKKKSNTPGKKQI